MYKKGGFCYGYDGNWIFDFFFYLRMGSIGLKEMFTKAITAEINEKTAVTDKNMIVVNHSPGSITSSATFSAYCRCNACAAVLKNKKKTQKIFNQTLGDGSQLYHYVFVCSFGKL